MNAELTHIFTELKELGVASITANYSGSGGSGQFDGITVSRGYRVETAP